MTAKRDAGIGGKVITAIIAVAGMSLWGVVGYGAVEKGAGGLERSRYLLLDSRVIDNVSGVKLTLGKVAKHPGNPLFGRSSTPWVDEQNCYDNFYPNVIYDAQVGLFRLWHHTYLEPDEKTATLYAESDDGINWRFPDLGLVSNGGNKNNNILFDDIEGASVFVDDHETDPSKRFKMVGQYNDNGPADNELVTGYSADGINWTLSEPLKSIDAMADTHNMMIWAPTENRYVILTRNWSRCDGKDDDGAPSNNDNETDPYIDNRKGYRQVSRSVSSNVMQGWSRAENMFEGESTRFQTHDLSIFYYGGVYLGMTAIWDTGGDGQVWPELCWSADTVKWHRICPGTPFIPNSSVKKDKDWGMVWRASRPIFMDRDETWIYYGGFDNGHGNDRGGYLMLATMKKDRWAGYHAGSSTGSIETTLVKCNGKALNICADVKDGGSIRAEIIGVSGLGLVDSVPVTADVTDGAMTWKGKDVSALVSKRIKIRFELKNATLYSFSFSDTAR